MPGPGLEPGPGPNPLTIMPLLTYEIGADRPEDRPLVWLAGEIRTPPFSPLARMEAGFLLRRLQQGGLPSMPQSRPMPAIGPRCHELRVRDAGHAWRIVYRVDPDAIVVAAVFDKKSEATPRSVMAACRRRLQQYDQTKEGRP